MDDLEHRQIGFGGFVIAFLIMVSVLLLTLYAIWSRS